MNQNKRKELSDWLLDVSKTGDKELVRKLVLLMTLVTETFAPGWIHAVHMQNMARAEHGRHSDEATKQSGILRSNLEQFASDVEALDVCAERCKHEFVACNPANKWSTTPPHDKAKEELVELATALEGTQYSERVLDAILDFVYAGTEVAGIHC